VVTDTTCGSFQLVAELGKDSTLKVYPKGDSVDEK